MAFTITIPVALAPTSQDLTPGDRVEWTDAQVQGVRNDVLVIPVARELGINPAAIFQYVTVTLGDRVEKGAIIAEKKDFTICLRRTVYFSVERNAV